MTAYQIASILLLSNSNLKVLFITDQPGVHSFMADHLERTSRKRGLSRDEFYDYMEDSALTKSSLHIRGNVDHGYLVIEPGGLQDERLHGFDPTRTMVISQVTPAWGPHYVLPTLYLADSRHW